MSQPLRHLHRLNDSPPTLPSINDVVPTHLTHKSILSLLGIIKCCSKAVRLDSDNLSHFARLRHKKDILYAFGVDADFPRVYTNCLRG
jgi:hypothetical protein